MAFSSRSKSVTSAWILNTSNALTSRLSISIADEISSIKTAKNGYISFSLNDSIVSSILTPAPLPYWRVCRGNSDLSKSARSFSHVASHNTPFHFSTFLNCWLTETVSLLLLCKQGSEIAENVETCSHASKRRSTIVETISLKSRSRTPFTSASCFSKYMLSRAWPVD